jgi:hypothetical protein
MSQWPEIPAATASTSGLEQPPHDTQTAALFNTPTLCRLSGANNSQVEQWYKAGILTPEQHATRGGARGWLLHSVIETAMMLYFAQLGFSLKQLQQLAATNRTAISPVVPAVGFDLRARALFGIFIEQIKGTAAMLGRNRDAEHVRWMRQAKAVVKDVNCWRTDAVHPRLAALLASSATVGIHAEG